MKKAKKIVWKPLKVLTPGNFEKWLMQMAHEPYVHDTDMQAIVWIRNITKAIKKVEPHVGCGLEIEYLYWDALQKWDFVLNCISIARATDNFDCGNSRGWQSVLLKLTHWIDSQANDPRFIELFHSGTSFFYDMRSTQTFTQLQDPITLAAVVNKAKINSPS